MSQHGKSATATWTNEASRWDGGQVGNFALVTTATVESLAGSGGPNLGRRALAFEALYAFKLSDNWGLAVDVEMRYENLKFVDGSGRDTSWNWTIGLLPFPRHYVYH